MAQGAIEIFKSLENNGFSVIIISHKSEYSAKSSLDLHSPVREWLVRALDEVSFNLDNNLFLEESRGKKISRIRQERVTYFVDDLLEVFLEPEFPRQVNGFWLRGRSNELTPRNVTMIRELSEVLQYV